MVDSKPAHRLYAVIVGLYFLAGGFLVGLSLLPFDWVKPAVDAMARDGMMESFTAPRYDQVRLAMQVLGFMLLISGGLSVLARDKASLVLEGLLRYIGHVVQSLGSDTRHLVASVRHARPDRNYGVALVGLTSLAALHRMIFLSQQMSHDEAYTVVAFAARPLRYILTDYHLPNNHVFHTLLVSLSYHLFGNQPWVVRLPAFLAGVLLVPAGYLAASKLYDRDVGLLTAASIAFVPVLVDYSTSARGYTLIGLITLILLTMGSFLKGNRNRVIWILFVVTSTIGFYTIPIMFYPFGMVMAWLALSALVGDIHPGYGRAFLRYLVVAGMTVSVLTFLLYTPIFVLGTGVDSVIDNGFVRALDWDDFAQSLPARLRNTWQEWSQGLPTLAMVIFISGFIASLIYHQRLATHRIHLVLPASLWIGLVLVVQRTAPWPRVWLFLFPLFLMGVSAGILGIMRQVWRSFEARGNFALITILVIAVPLLVLQTVQAKATYDSKFAGVLGDAEEITLFLKSYLQPEDVVLVSSPVDAPLMYYFDMYGLSKDYFYKGENRDIDRAFIVVSEKYDQTLEEVASQRGFSEAVDPGNGKVVHRYKKVAVYQVNVGTPKSID